MSSPRRYCGCNKSPLRLNKLASKSPKSPKTVVWDPTQGRYIPVTSTKMGLVVKKLDLVKSPLLHRHRHHHVEDEPGLD